MKNTELIKLDNILKFKGELTKVAPLEQSYYNTREAAKFYGCAYSQVKGYLSNYKQYFEGYVEVIGEPGKQTTRISETGMFLLAILLCNKSSLAKEITNNVRELVLLEKKIVESKAKKETKNKAKKTVKKEQPEQLKMDLGKEIEEVKEEPKKKTVKIEKVVIKNGEVTEEEQIEMPLEKLNTRDALEEMFNKFTKENKVSKEDMIVNILRKIAKIKADIEREDSCLNKITNKNMQLVELINELKITNAIADNYLDKCRILGLEELESAILVQESLVYDKDIDAQILNALYNKAKEEISRKRGVLRESIELLASEKFNGEIQDTYHFLSNELRFCMGINMKKIREKQRFAGINPTSYLDMIVNENAFDDAMNIISTLLAE